MSLDSGIYRIWRQRPWLWVPPLLFFLANLALFSTYRVVYSGKVESLRGELAAQEGRLERLSGQAAEREALVGSAVGTRDALDQLYGDRLRSERARFTKVTAEIRDLARRSGLEPASMRYPSEQIEDYGLVKRFFNFSVSGTYVELRQFINLLELTPTFVTLEQISVTGEEGNQLGIRLTLSTLFSDGDRGAEGAEADDAESSSAERGAA